MIIGIVILTLLVHYKIYSKINYDVANEFSIFSGCFDCFSGVSYYWLPISFLQDNLILPYFTLLIYRHHFLGTALDTLCNSYNLY